MKNKKCRLCSNELVGDPILKYDNMPALAQNLPKSEDLRNDKGVNLRIYECHNCGLVQLSNDPVYYYREVIRASGVSKEMTEFRIVQFKNFVNKYSLNNKRILEVGCGKGEYLELMKKTGINAYGIEYNQDSVDECIKKKLNVKKDFIENEKHKVNESQFDAFFILNFLEHLPNLNGILKGIRNNLKEDGVGIIEVPNFDMMIKENLFSEFMTDHLFYFTEKTLKTTLNMNGFDVIECGVIWHDYIISAVVKKREKIDISGFNRNQELIRKQFENYFEKNKGKKIAIWGAGHQSFAIISMIDLKDKIKYIIDSAEFKQGRYSPASHIPIVSPETLNIDPIDSVIIIAGSYSDEVAKILKEKYDKKLKVAILRENGLKFDDR